MMMNQCWLRCKVRQLSHIRRLGDDSVLVSPKPGVYSLYWQILASNMLSGLNPLFWLNRSFDHSFKQILFFGAIFLGTMFALVRASLLKFERVPSPRGLKILHTAAL